MTQKDINLKVVNLLRKIEDPYPDSGLKRFLQMEKL